MKRLFYADVYVRNTYYGHVYHDSISTIMADDPKEAAQILKDKLSKNLHFPMEDIANSCKYDYYRTIDGSIYLENMQIDEKEYDDASEIYQHIRLYEGMKVYPIGKIIAIKLINVLRKGPINKSVAIQRLYLGSYYDITFFNNTTRLERYETHYSLDNNHQLITKTSRREYMDYTPIKEDTKFKLGDVVHIIHDELNIDFVVCDIPKHWFSDENWENVYEVYAKDGAKCNTIRVHKSELKKAEVGIL